MSSINKKRICLFEHTSEEGTLVGSEPRTSWSADWRSTDELLDHWQKLYFCRFLKSFIPDVRISKLNWMSDFCENEHMEFHSIQQSMFPILCDPILIKSSSAAHNSRNSIFAMTRKLYCWSIPDTLFPAKIYLQILIKIEVWLKSRSRRNGQCSQISKKSTISQYVTW